MPTSTEVRSTKEIEAFCPPFLFRNRHLQTILTPATRSKSKLKDSKPWSISHDGVSLYGDLSLHPSNRHVIVVFHGLAGSRNSPYVTGIAKKLEDTFSVLRISLRGGEDLSEHTYHAGLTQDIDWIVRELQQQNFDVSLLGFSLAGAMILRWLETKREIKSAFIISPPLNLLESAKNLDLRRNRIYRSYYLKKLVYLLKKKRSMHPEIFRPYAIDQISTIRDFDELYTAPRFGFSSAEDYYEKTTPRNPENIQNQVRIVHSMDDPFIGHTKLRSLQNQCQNLQICLTQYGGHAGFFGGPQRGYVADQWAKEYFKEILGIT